VNLVLAVDGGASKTEVVLDDLDTGARRAARIGPSSLGTSRPDAIARSVVEAVIALHATPKMVGAIAAGLAGVDRPGDGETVAAAFSRAFPGTRVQVMNDTLLALRAGTKEHVGIALIAGTGTNCIARTADGREARIGGLGYASGDFGSGKDIAREALHLAARARDGRGEPTMLASRLEGKLAETAVPPIVFTAAAQGDVVAREILVHAGTELGFAAATLARRAFPPPPPGTLPAGLAPPPIPLILAGGVIQGPPRPNPLLDALVRKARSVEPRLAPRVLEVPPVEGAVLLARELARAPAQ
jgi:N-acetylglucosamine kinase-like BadF-type ATPase